MNPNQKDTKAGMRGRKEDLVIIQSVREMGPGGGVSGVAYYLDREFAKEGYTTRCFTKDDLLSMPPRRQNEYISKYAVARDVLIYSLVGTWRLAHKWKSENHVIISHNDAVYGDIYINHGLHKAMLKKSSHRWRMLLRNPLHGFLLAREELRHRMNVHRYIVCLSEYDREEMARMYPVDRNRIVVIPNGVDIDKFKPSESSRIEKRTQLGARENDLVLLFAGHKFRSKGLYHLIRALGYLPRNVILWVAGGDELQIKSALRISEEEGVSGRIKFLGNCSDMPKLYNGSDIFVLPSETESWGLVGTEALASGKPILMTAVGGIPDYLRNGMNGFFIRQDPEDIAEKIKFLESDRGARIAMGYAARESAMEYSWSNIAKQYLELIDMVWKEKRLNV